MAIEPDSLELLPLFAESEATIRARWQAWANEGLSVDDADQWVDTREGNFFSIATEPGIRECARIYDLMGTEFPAAVFPLFSWGEYLDDNGSTYKVERLAATPAAGVVTFTGAPKTVIGSGFTVGVEASVEGEEGQQYEVTEGGQTPALTKKQEEEHVEETSVELPVVAITAGSAGNAAAAAVTLPLSSPSAGSLTAITNPEPLVGGTDPETDEALRERVLAVFEGRGPGNIHDYEIWARSYSNEIGIVTVLPVWNGPGTVKLVILTAEGAPVAAEVVEGLKAFLDPIAGKGDGEAPIGHEVTVVTAKQVGIKVEAHGVVYEPGYSAAGGGGTVALEAQMNAAIAAYIRSEPPGGEVVVNKVIGRLTAFPGIHDVGFVKLNGSATNIKLAATPTAEVGFLEALTLT